MALPCPGLAPFPFHLAPGRVQDDQLAALQCIPTEAGASCRARYWTKSSLQPNIMGVHQPNDEQRHSPRSQRRGTHMDVCVSVSGDFTPGISEAPALESMAQSLGGRSHTTWSHLGVCTVRVAAAWKLSLVKIAAVLTCSALPREKMMIVPGSGLFWACFTLPSCRLGSRIADWHPCKAAGFINDMLLGKCCSGVFKLDLSSAVAKIAASQVKKGFLKELQNTCGGMSKG